MYRNIVFVLILLCCTALSTPGFADEAITRLSDKQSISFSQFISDIQNVDVILIAETHDNIKHHNVQLNILRSLKSKKLPLAIGLEMFQTNFQGQLDDWVEGRISEENFQEFYAKNWSYDWNLYRDIFIYARDMHIPLIALNIPKEIVIKVARNGFAALSLEERKNLPLGITCDLNNPQTEFLKKTFQEVFKHEANGKIFDYFCEAQAVRNSGMAMNIANYRMKYPSSKIVVLTGTWHAVKHGIPERLENINNLVYKVILQEIPELGSKNASPIIADYVID